MSDALTRSNREQEPQGLVAAAPDLPDDIYYTTVSDDAMLPMAAHGVGGYMPGDRIAVSPSATPRDGSVVVARMDGQDTAILREFRQRGAAIDLVATNGDYPIESITVRTPGRIGGVVIEHTRRVG